MTVDTTYSDGGRTITTRVGGRVESRANTGMMRGRTYSGGRWRDTIVFPAAPGETLRVGTP